MLASPGERLTFFFADDLAFAQDIEIAVTPALKHPANPVIGLGDMHEWDSLQVTLWAGRSVIYDIDDGIFKMWYQGCDLSTERWWLIGYATSDDGVHWEKPDLGLYEYNGNKHNNVCYDAVGPVMKDDSDPDPARRYQMAAKEGPHKGEIRLVVSPDGIHWTPAERIDLPAWHTRVDAGPSPDIVVFMRDDTDPDPTRRYKIVWQDRVPATKPGPSRVRAKFMAVGPSLSELRDADPAMILTPNEGRDQENHFLALHNTRGRTVMLYEYGWYTPNRTGIFGQYAADIRLAVSRDGRTYERIQLRQVSIARGAPGMFDSQMLVIAQEPVVHDDKIWLYYGTGGEELQSWPPPNIPESYQWTSTGSVRISRIGLATLPIDGYTHLRTLDAETPGAAITHPLDHSAGAGDLVLNLDQTYRDRDFVEVELLHAERDEAVEGFARADGRLIDRSGVNVPVRWGGRRLADLPAGQFRVRLWIAGRARVFAVGFEA